MDNYFELKIKAISANEGFARSTVASFATILNPTLEQINDIKTSVSEAVTNCIVHGYCDREDGEIVINTGLNGEELVIIITDNGIGIENVEEALIPFYTSKPEQERSGMGFTLMQSFMDSVVVDSALGRGTKVTMTKNIVNQKEKYA